MREAGDQQRSGSRQRSYAPSRPGSLHVIPLGPPGADRDQGVGEESMSDSTALSWPGAMRAAKA